MQAYVRFTCNADGKTATAETQCATATCKSCKDRRERLSVPACFTAQHHGQPMGVTLECAHGNPLVNVYTFMPGVQAKCPIGTGAMLESSIQHMSGQCEMDSHGHHEHEDIDDHDDHHDDDHGDHHDDDHDDHDDPGGKGVAKVKHMIDVLVRDARQEHVVRCALCDVCERAKVHCMV